MEPLLPTLFFYTAIGQRFPKPRHPGVIRVPPIRRDFSFLIFDRCSTEASVMPGLSWSSTPSTLTKSAKYFMPSSVSSVL